jgi:hypothetical protein
MTFADFLTVLVRTRPMIADCGLRIAGEGGLEMFAMSLWMEFNPRNEISLWELRLNLVNSLESRVVQE